MKEGTTEKKVKIKKAEYRISRAIVPPLCIVPLLKNFIELYSTREGILHLSRDPVIRFEPSFFCLIALIELFKIKKDRSNWTGRS